MLQRMTKTGLAGLALTLGLGMALAQAADTFDVDPAHADVGFTVNHLGFSDTFGRFNKVEGVILFDEDKLEASSVEVTIDAASVDTNHAKRDEDLRSENFFDVAKFPTITFKSTGIEKTGENTGRITGDLTLHGVTKPVVLDATFINKAPHPLPSYNGVIVAGFSGTTKIKRSDFGMTTYAPAIGDEIAIRLAIDTFKRDE